MRALGATIVGAALTAASAAPTGKIYGARNIKRHLQRQKRDYVVEHGLGGYVHDDKREIARRLRQAERDARNRALRWFASQGIPMRPPGAEPTRYTAVGLSRRGREVAL